MTSILPNCRTLKPVAVQFALSITLLPIVRLDEGGSTRNPGPRVIVFSISIAAMGES